MRGNWLKNHFRHLKLYSNPPSWLSRNGCHLGTFRKTKDWSSYFWEGQPFRSWHVEVHCEIRLNSTKTGIFFLNLRLWHNQKPKIWSFFYGKKFIKENSVVWKLGTFGLKINTFTCCSYLCCISCRIYYVLVADMWHLKHSAITLDLIRSFTNPKRLTWF